MNIAMKNKLRLLLLLVFILLNVINGTAQSTLSNQAKLKWWRDARFGMFIHWGVYAVPGGVYKGFEQNRGGAEWIMNRMKIPVREYQAYAKQFNPVKFDAKAWVKIAKDAGMKYIVITAKHHDGFALFETKASKWNIVDATPYGKDILKELAVACKKEGIKLGFYYSHAQDWNNPGGSAARKPATEGWPNPDSTRIDAYTKLNNGHWDPLQTTVPMSEYIDKVSVPQVRELLTNYGEVAVLWWDTPTNMTDEFAEKFQPLLKLQPNMITNDRLKRPNYAGDYKTPEQKIPNISELDGKDWETCMTMNGSWGWRSYKPNFKSNETLIRNLIDIASKGGNYLLNVGPNAEGEFPQQSIDGLKAIGDWMKINSESIYGTQASPLASMDWGRFTSKETKEGTILYLSVFEWPTNGTLIIPNFKNKLRSVTLLTNGESLKTAFSEGALIIYLPAASLDKIATVIKMELKGKVEQNLKTESITKMKTGELD
jgi:alpha-L-fucosidase